MRRPPPSWLLCCLAAAACGGGDAAPSIDAPPDAPPDAAVDTPVEPSALTLDPGLADFGQVVVAHASPRQTFHLTNTGAGASGPITVRVAGAQADDFAAAAAACGALAPGAACELDVVFSPRAEGDRIATLEVTAAGGGTATALLQGVGVPATAHLAIAPTPYDFGQVQAGTPSAPALFVVTNDGVATAGALAISRAGLDAAAFVLDPALPGDCTSATQLAPGATCTVRVHMETAAVGGKIAQLVVSAAPGGTAIAALTGTSTMPGAAALTLTPLTAALGTVAVGQTGAAALFTVANVGDSPSDTVSVLASSPRFVIGADGCSGHTLAAHADCSFTVAYAPSIAGGAGGADRDDGVVTVHATSGGTVEAAVTGTGSATLAVAVTGVGRVVSTPAGLDCAAGTCTATFTRNTVTLTALPAAGNGLAGWTGACAGEPSATCVVTLDAARTAGATFAPLRRLTVAATGGTVTSVPAGITCPGTCAADYLHGTVVTLTASPDAGYRFGGWSQAGCAGVTCTVTMDAARAVTASFVRQYTLTVHARDLGVASGSGVTITDGAGATANCAATIGAGATCALVYDAGTEVVLARTLGANTGFGGWAGDCAGTGGCGPLIMDHDRAVDARFAAYRVTIAIAGTGTVAIAPTTAGATCPDDTCTPVFPGGTAVTLTPQPLPGAAFWGWSGACSGGAACALTMTDNQTARAEFRTARLLTVTKAGSGAVASAPAGIDCPVGCTSQTAAFPDGRVVVLTAAPAAGYELAGWGGACAGATGSTCTVTMDAARTAAVTFGAGADLQVTAVACAPDPVAPGAALACDVTVRNAGTVGVGAVTNRLVLSADATIDAGDPALGTCSVGALAAGASATVTCTGTIPAATAVGAYHAGVIADSANAIPESSEGNNTGADPIAVARPDVTVTSVACTPEPAAPGATVSCTVGFADAGPAVGGFAYDLRLSADVTIDGNDPLVATCTVAGIAAGGTATATCSGALPSALGRYRLGAVADRGAAIAEADETNNTASTAIRVGTNLAIGGLACAAAAAPGGTVTCDYTVANQGAAVGAFATAVRLSTDAVVTAADPLLGQCYVPGLAAGATTSLSCAVVIPAGQAVAAYTLGVAVDAPDVVPEWDFSDGVDNQATAALVVTGATGTDLAIDGVACADGVPPGGALRCTVRLIDLGTVAAPASTLLLRWSTTGSVPSSAVTLGTCAAPAVAAGGVATVTCDLTAPGSGTVIYVAAWADSGGVVTETNEANNKSPIASFRLGSATPDLVVQAVSCPDLVAPGATITCDVTIANRGTSGTVPFANRLVRSTDAIITASDSPGADCNATAGVGAQASITLACTLTLTGVGASAPYLGVVVDTGGAVTEADEGNNTGYDPITVVAAGVDLDPATVRCTAAEVAQGGAVACEVVIDNQGTTAAPATRTTLSIASTPIGDCATPAIPALGTATVVCLGTVPLGTAPGTATVVATADSALQVTETSETDNTATATVAVLLAVPDLVAQSVACSSVGSAATCTIAVANAGGAAVGGFRISLRQSTDFVVDASDPEVGTCTASGLAADSARVFTCAFTLTATAEAVGAIVDADGAIAESLETNNLVAGTGAWSVPDLVITAMTCSYASAGGGTATCNVTVANTGAGAASASDLTIRRSTNSSYDLADVFIATAAVPALAPGATQVVTVAGLSTHVNPYIVARVDDALAVLESTEGNNTAATTW